MIDFKEISHSDDWELFSRDLLSEEGFFIESSPDRGPDGGKDLLISEQLKGNLGNYKFRWLVSCKHFAHSGKAVNESDEKNILERVKSFKADGFLGVYSTLPSSGLNTRLNQLRENNEIKDFMIFDKKRIESILLKIGYSEILQRYFPKSFEQIKPINLITTTYEPIVCDACGKDLLMSLFENDYNANFVQVEELKDGGKYFIHDIYCACKGDCDRRMENELLKNGKGIITSWTDISDLIIPGKFIIFIMSLLNNIRSGRFLYSDEAFEKLKEFIIAISQKVVRLTTENEKDRLIDLIKYDL